MDNYNYFGGYGYGSNGDNTLIPKPGAEDVVNDKIDGLVGNAPEDLDTIAEIAQKVQDIEESIGGTDLSGLKEMIDAKVDKETLESDYTNTEGMNEAIGTAVSESAASKFGFAEYDTESKKITFYDNEADKNELGYIDASDFIKDGMIDNVEISGGNLVITFNTDSEKEEITLSLSDIFDASNYYTKEEVDAELEKKLDKTEIDNYYNKGEVDGEFEKYYNKEYVNSKFDALNTELSNKANIDDVYIKKEVDSKISAIEIPVVPKNISAFKNDAGYITEHQSLAGLFKSVEYDSAEKKINFKDETNTVVGYVDATDFVKDGMVNEVRVDENNNLVITFNTDSGKETISVSLGSVFEPSNYYTIDEIEKINSNYYTIDEIEKINSNYSTTEKMEAAIESALKPLVVRLNKLELTNAILIEKGTDTPEAIATKGAEDDVVAATDEAIKALSTNKTFKNVSIVGGEIGSDDVIYLTAIDNISVDGITVSGEKGTVDGKIVYAGNDINISNVNIEPGCTVYNVFEGSQDNAVEHCVDNFTARNVTVNDTELTHNVFNIYQLNDNAKVKISDSSFNLNMETSNIMTLSNYANAKNVTVTFENVDWTYENVPYADADKARAGLVIYQPAGDDNNVKTGDEYSDEATKTWTFNFIKCRYNGEKITENSLGTNKQVIYQYNVQNSGELDAPRVFGAINFE